MIQATMVISHNTFPKNDIWSDFEYSLCRVNRESMYWIASSTPTAAGR